MTETPIQPKTRMRGPPAPIPNPNAEKIPEMMLMMVKDMAKLSKAWNLRVSFRGYPIACSVASSSNAAGVSRGRLGERVWDVRWDTVATFPWG
ncbi:hypothetical protein [Streptomyces sp. SDr-06]|uniref:hypothetical protein n=1 Tax=Streptomyces sp. SDr-06 TaxID=2267702 RepID=UPI00294FF4BA|nr:hypothetical protein [Streptomyces sp. SDr-06]